MTALIVTVVVVAWLTTASISVRAVSRIWLRHWVEGRPAGFAVVERYLERPTRLVVAAAAGVALTTIAAGAFAVRHRADGAEAMLTFLGLIAGMLVLGQVVPRALARRWAPRMLPILLPPLRLVEIVLAPIVALSRLVEHRLQRNRAAPDRERDGLEDLLREGELEGVGGQHEIAIITGVVRFGEKTLCQVMTPAARVFALDESLDTATLMSRLVTSTYTRVPITRNGSLDDVAGMMHAFDILRTEGARPPLRPVPSADADTRCNELLFRMLRARAHLAIVQDEQRHTIGVVTLEDLLEELVGDIRDEHDGPAPARHSQLP